MMELEFYIEIFKNLLRMLLQSGIETIAKWIRVVSQILLLD